MGYRKGQWVAICDVCGFRFHIDEMRKTWNGLLVDKRCYEGEHPQKFIRAGKDPVQVPIVNTPPEDIFIQPQYRDMIVPYGELSIIGHQPNLLRTDFPSDPYLDNVVLLLQGHGTDGQPQFDDKCILNRDWSSSPTTNAVISSTQYPYGSRSYYFRKVGGVNVPAYAPYDTFGTNFTAEFWYYQIDAFDGWGGFLGHNASLTGTGRWFIGTSTSVFNTYSIWINGNDDINWSASPNLLTLNQWNFIALSCIDGRADLYLNGNRIIHDVPMNDQATSEIYFGGVAGSSAAFKGYFADVRLTRGVGRYSGLTCPVPSEPFPTYPGS